uniref:Uncharacterized protein n=1 Tax=Opuntia streptacantha TaxID=393608 RepID=A0A7C9DNT2_OPUST
MALEFVKKPTKSCLYGRYDFPAFFSFFPYSASYADFVVFFFPDDAVSPLDPTLIFARFTTFFFFEPSSTAHDAVSPTFSSLFPARNTNASLPSLWLRTSRSFTFQSFENPVELLFRLISGAAAGKFSGDFADHEQYGPSATSSLSSADETTKSFLTGGPYDVVASSGFSTWSSENGISGRIWPLWKTSSADTGEVSSLPAKKNSKSPPSSSSSSSSCSTSSARVRFLSNSSAISE